MSEICPAYLSTGDCLVKVLSNPRLSSFISKVNLEMVVDSWSKDCQGNINSCTFKEPVEQKQETIDETPEPIEEPVFSTKVSIHKLENAYLVKSDVLIYPKIGRAHV